jgi:hypothetical protein
MPFVDHKRSSNAEGIASRERKIKTNQVYEKAFLDLSFISFKHPRRFFGVPVIFISVTCGNNLEANHFAFWQAVGNN